MAGHAAEQNKPEALHPYLSPAAAWALSVGTSVGWGSLVVTSRSYLSQAGPMGSVLGLVIGGALMLLIARNFHYMACRYPDAGGVYAYTKNVFGYDRAFLVSWFLSLTYISMFWANATSLPLFARYFMRGVFSVGYLYTIFGFEVYLGEALITLAAICLATWLCIRSKQAAARVMVVLVLTFTLGITVCFVMALRRHGAAGVQFEPLFVPDKSALSQVMRITFLTPWAFIGFEGVTHSSEEFRFKTSRLFRILVISVLTSTALYIFVTLLSITAYPAGCGSWLDYITRLDEFQGIEGLPAFYAARAYLGDVGVYLLTSSLLALVLTSLIGNLRALSRLFCAVARDDILPRRFAGLNGKQIPQNAMLLVAGLSLPIPFLGRTAIGWIVDVTTIGATILYGFVSAAAWKTAKSEGDRIERVTGALGFAVMILFGFYLLFPNIFADYTLETETYILLIVWSIIGFFYFRRVISKDHARRYGKAIIVWISLLALIVFMSMIWSGRRDEAITREAVQEIQSYFTGSADPAILAIPQEEFIGEKLTVLHTSNVLNTTIVSILFVMALGAMLINHFSMRKYEAMTAKERDSARDVAYRDSLTGVKSKHAYVEQEQSMAQKIYSGEVGAFAIVVCDVNGLKFVNDTLGHKAGDMYIRSASQLICEYFKHSPVFRIGGDEFAVILQGQDYENRTGILDALNEQIERNLGTGNVVASLGMAEYRPGIDNTFHAVFTRADALMYERKKQLKAMGAKTRD